MPVLVAALITEVSLKTGSMISLTLIFLKFVLDFQDPLMPHMNLRIGFSISKN